MAGAPFWLFAGGVAPCPEPRGLKAQRPVFRQVPTPRLPSLTLGAAVGSQTERLPTMTILNPTFPPPPFRAIPITALTAEQFAALVDLKKAKQEAAAEVERLIAFLDMVDGFSLSELEEAVDDVPCDDSELEFSFAGVTAAEANLPCPQEDELENDGENDEPSLASPENHVTINGCMTLRQWRDSSGDQSRWAQGDMNDCEGDACDDDREGDEQQHGGDEHDGTEPDEDGEPSLGWTEQMAQGQGTWGSSDDKEEGGSYITDAARQRYRPFDRYASNRNGQHVDTERGYGRASRRLTNLSDQQRAAVAPRLDREEVRL